MLTFKSLQKYSVGVIYFIVNSFAHYLKTAPGDEDIKTCLTRLSMKLYTVTR